MVEVWGCGGLGRRLEVGGSQAGAEGRQAKGWQLRQVSAPSSFTLNSGAEVEAAPRHQLWDPHQHTGGVGGVSKWYPGPQVACALCSVKDGWAFLKSGWASPLDEGVWAVSMPSPAPCTRQCVCLHPPTPRWSLTHHMSLQSDTVPDAQQAPWGHPLDGVHVPCQAPFGPSRLDARS